MRPDLEPSRLWGNMNYWTKCVCDRCGEKEMVYQTQFDRSPISADWYNERLCMWCSLMVEKAFATHAHVVHLPLGTWLRRYTEGMK